MTNKSDLQKTLAKEIGINLSALRKCAGMTQSEFCLLYTSDAADERSSVDLGGRRIIKKKETKKKKNNTTKKKNKTTRTRTERNG